MTNSRLAAALTALLSCLACTHATQTRAEEKSSGSGTQTDGKGEERGEVKNGTTKRTPTRVETITTSKTTKQMFKPDGIKKLQAALDDKMKSLKKPPENENSKDALQSDKGPPVDDKKKAMKIEKVDETNNLDSKTQLALQQFQKSEGLPETGLPDYESLRRLGLKPSDIFEHDTPSERVGVH